MSGNNLNISLIDIFRSNDWCLTLLTHKLGIKHILILVYFTCFQHQIVKLRLPFEYGGASGHLTSRARVKLCQRISGDYPQVY